MPKPNRGLSKPVVDVQRHPETKMHLDQAAMENRPQQYLWETSYRKEPKSDFSASTICSDCFGQK